MTEANTNLQPLTRAQKRIAKRARRNDPKVKARRYARRQARAALAADRIADVNVFDVAYRMAEARQ